MEILKNQEITIMLIEEAGFEGEKGKVEMDKVWFVLNGRMKFNNRVNKEKLKEGKLFCDIELRVDKKKGELKYIIHPKDKK